MSDVAKIAEKPECERCRDTGIWAKSTSVGRGWCLTGGYCDCLAGIKKQIEDTPRLAVRAHLLENHDG